AVHRDARVQRVLADQAVKRADEWPLAKIPSAEKVVFEAGAHDGRRAIAGIDVDVLWRFEKAQVTAVASLHRQHAARVVATAARVSDGHGRRTFVAPGAELVVKSGDSGRAYTVTPL